MTCVLVLDRVEFAMPRLILVKHSLPEIVPDVPSAEWHLSAEGRRRASVLADRLPSVESKRVFSSYEPKAMETADILAGHMGLPREICKGLEEHRRPHAVLFSDRVYEETLAAVFAHPNELVFGEETANQAGVRFAAAVKKLLSRTNDEDTLVVAHGTVISLFVAGGAGLDPFPLWRELGLPSYVSLSLPDFRILEVLKSV
jgi:broad specificity phosphatase PhoE